MLLALFGAIGLLDRIIGPGVRWFFRRKANRAIEELNTRLHLRIQPFKITRRQTLIDQLLLDPQVVKAVETHVSETGVPRDVAMAKAERYAREIVPAFNAYAYTRIGTRVSRWASTFIYRVRLGYHDDAAISSIDPEATVVFVMNHRSNVDYLLVTYLASASATLSYAVGEWARIWLLQNIIRAMGAYFIRRDSGNVLYRRVLARYVAMASRSGVTQAIFPEGGLSRDGLLRQPKFGLLGYMISDFDPEEHRDVVFVPVGVNYDRVLEDRVLLGASDKNIGQRTFRFGLWEVFRFVLNLVVLRIRGRLYRYGYACASFGKPVSLRDWCAANKAAFAGVREKKLFANVEHFGRDLMDQVGQVVPVLPVALVAMLLEEAGEAGLGGLELKSKAYSLLQELEASGAHIHLPRSDLDYAITTGLRMLTMRHIVSLKAGRYCRVNDQSELIAYYANSIRHLRRK
ncbi:MAG: 1-acyl-sn-glycerol-3-phosphate acyltransferase [Rhizobiaceae bacterium]